MARPTKLTPEVQEAIVEGIKTGLTYKQAAQLVGIDETTLHRWRRRGRSESEEIFCLFEEAIKKAVLAVRIIHFQQIDKAGAGRQIVETVTEIHDDDGNLVELRTVTREMQPNWRASAWILERRFPSEFGKHARPQPVEEHDPFQEWIDMLAETETEPTTEETT